MAPKRRDPERLDDVIFVEGLPAHEGYGADHAPAFDAEKRAETYATANAALGELWVRLNGLPLLGALGAIQSATALAPPPQRVNTALVELAQVLILQHPAAGDTPLRADIEALIAALEAHMHLFLGETSKAAASAKRGLLERRMIQTLLVRHTNYPHHTSRIARRMGERLGEFGKAALGMTFSDAMNFAEAAAVAVTLQLRYRKTAKAVTQWLAGGKRPFDPAWTEAFRVDIALLSRGLGLSEDAARNVIERLSIGQGGLSEAVTDHLHLGNPIWRKPFVEADGHFYLFSPGTIYASSFDIMAELADAISTDGTQILGDTRGLELESLLEEALGEIFPGADLLTGVHWHDPIENKRRETDAVVIIDGIILIFEAKGDALNPAARRGSESWFKAFDDIVTGASYQAWRLETVLRDLTEPVLELATDEGIRKIYKSDVRHIVRFGVSFERVTMMSYGRDPLLDARIRATGAAPMPVFTIGDLWQLRDLLPSIGHRIHFFLRRAELEENFQFLGDELDLLALYLRTGFAGLENDREGRIVNVYGLSDFLRHYQKGTPHFDASIKPPARTTPFWNRLIADKEKRQPTFWTDIVYDLLNVPHESQRRFIDDINKVRRSVRRKVGEGPVGALMQAPGQLRPAIFACVVMGKMSAEARLVSARHAFEELAAAHPDERLCVFVLDAMTKKEPALPYYRGLRWEKRPQVEMIDGNPVSSGFSAKWQGT